VRRRYDVCSAVASDLPYDARVWKQARTLSAAGRSVRLVGCRYGDGGAARRSEGPIDVFEAGLGPRGGGGVLRKARAAAALWLGILRTPARAYHAHNVHTVPPAWLASRLRRAALVYDAHELYGNGDRRGLRARLAGWVGGCAERFAVRAADAVITTNRSRAAVLGERHGRADVVVLANVPALVGEVEPLDPGYPEGRRVLLYQGGIYPESRAFLESVLALRYLADVDLVVLGFGHPEMLERIRGWAEAAGVGSRVHLLGPRPFDELVRTAAAADVGLVPVRPDTLNEVLGDTNKLHEYLMAGLPVVASDLPEIRAVVEEGDPPVGEVFEPSSPESIASAVRSVLADRELYGRRRAEARRLAVERHNWQLEEPRLLALYDALLPRRDTASVPQAVEATR
jgi:glycosyltransferase involved in cell wall biosynthesis